MWQWWVSLSSKAGVIFASHPRTRRRSGAQSIDGEDTAAQQSRSTSSFFEMSQRVGAPSGLYEPELRLRLEMIATLLNGLALRWVLDPQRDRPPPFDWLTS